MCTSMHPPPLLLAHLVLIRRHASLLCLGVVRVHIDWASYRILSLQTPTRYEPKQPSRPKIACITIQIEIPYRPTYNLESHSVFRVSFKKSQQGTRLTNPIISLTMNQAWVNYVQHKTSKRNVELDGVPDIAWWSWLEIEFLASLHNATQHWQWQPSLWRLTGGDNDMRALWLSMKLCLSHAGRLQFSLTKDSSAGLPFKGPHYQLSNCQ